MKTCLVILLSSLCCIALQSQPGAITEHLKIDQFGYPPGVEKVCVINNPTEGYDYDASDFYTPGDTLHVIDSITGNSVFSAALDEWNNGASYDQSGDEIWWFDFSDVADPGTYYIYDPANDTRSFTFRIAPDVYNEALVHSVRAFFYQRSGFAKETQYAGVWNDAASHLGPAQDWDCRLATNPVASTSRSLEGGWYDAGDFNKYVNFTYGTLHDLLFAYIERPGVWGDDYNIPESGNGIPDLLDEVKWELDWLLRMQEGDGSVLMKVSVTEWQSASPPSADDAVRRYGPAQASATCTAAGMFAVASIAYDATGIPAMQAYADTLLQAATDAWDWTQANPGYSSYDNAGFFSANPEISEYRQLSAKAGAAVALFVLTGESEYQDYVDDHYDAMQPMQWTSWYPYETPIQDLLLLYATHPDATPAVASAIEGSFTTSMASSGELITAYNNAYCGYRAYLYSGENHWGSHQPRCHNAMIFYNMIQHELDTDTMPYRHAALGYLNFMHGVNPISLVMLTNMYDYGAEKSANEMYHGWFAHGTDYDNALTSLYGPPPGYLTGGFNQYYQPDPAYGGEISPPQNQPPLKAYKDWNTSWPENSWEITEPSIYGQAAYVRLVSRFANFSAGCEKVVTTTADDGFGSLRAAVDCALAGDTITFALNPSDTITLTSTPLLMQKNMTLRHTGPGHIRIATTLSEPLVTISSGSQVLFEHLELISTGHPLLENAGQLHLKNVRLLVPAEVPAIPFVNVGTLTAEDGIEVLRY